jgi:aspartyl/asparaginyl beta-hydroxylase (cupin superfamily)
MRTQIRKSLNALRAKLRSRVVGWLEGQVRKHSLVGSHTFFDNGLFPWIVELEENWRDIRNELDQVLQGTYIPTLQEISKGQAYLTRDKKWKTFFFYIYGHESEPNTRRCPRTVELLAKIPGMKTAMFSMLDPGKHIPEHRGPYNGVLRLHLGLRIPRDRMNCKIRVGNDFGYWEEGKALVFDDSHPHEVWNNTSEQRMVLFVDFRRPLSPRVARLNELFIKHMAASRMIQDAIGKLDKINARIAAG